MVAQVIRRSQIQTCDLMAIDYLTLKVFYSVTSVTHTGFIILVVELELHINIDTGVRMVYNLTIIVYTKPYNL